MDARLTSGDAAPGTSPLYLLQYMTVNLPREQRWVNCFLKPGQVKYTKDMGFAQSHDGIAVARAMRMMWTVPLSVGGELNRICFKTFP